MAVDLTKLSDGDLQALQANDLSKVSDDGLYELSGNAHPGLWQSLKATGDVAASGLSHAIVAPAVEGIAGTAARLFNHDPAQAKANADRLFVYHAQTPQGQHLIDQVSQAAAPVTGAVGGAVNSARDFVGKYGGHEAQRILDQVGGTVSDIAGAVPLGGALAHGVSELGAAARPVADAAEVARTPDQLAHAGGYTIPPSVLDTTTGAKPPNGLQKVLEAIGDRPTVRRGDIINAKAQTNNLVRQANNVPADKLLSPASLTEAKAPHIAVYREAEKAVPQALPMDKQYQADIAQAGSHTDSLRPTPAAVEKERAGAEQIQQANGSQLMATVSDYRAKGYKGKASPDPDQQAIGKTQLDIANALEAQLKRHLDVSNPGLAERFQGARTGFAKIEDAQAALVGHDIDPVIMRRLADNNPGISGEYRYIADMAERFPKIMTIKVPGLGANVLGHGVGMGLLGTAGYHLGGAYGMGAGMAAAPLLQAGARRVLDATRSVAANPRIALQTALADYVRQKGSPFPAGSVPFRPPGKALAMIDKRDYGVPTRARHEMPDEAQAPQGSTAGLPALLAGRSYQPAVPRGRSTPYIDHGRPPVAVNHPAHPHLDSSAAPPPYRAALSKRDAIEHIVNVLAGRGMNHRGF